MGKIEKIEKYDETIFKSQAVYDYFAKEVKDFNLKSILDFEIPIEIIEQLKEQDVQVVVWSKLFEIFDINTVVNLLDKIDNNFITFNFGSHTCECESMKMLSKDKQKEIILKGEGLSNLVNALYINGINLDVRYRVYNTLYNTLRDYINLDVLAHNFKTESNEEICNNLKKLSFQLFKQDSFTLAYIKHVTKEKMLPLIEELKSLTKMSDIVYKQKDIYALMSNYEEIITNKQQELKDFELKEDSKLGGYNSFIKKLTDMLDKFHHNNIDNTIVNKNEFKSRDIKLFNNDFNNL